jgi:hypothetical protein
MLHEMPSRETNPRNQGRQPEQRKDDRRQQGQRPQGERRRELRREDVEMLSPEMRSGAGMMPDSLPEKDNPRRQTPENWPRENFQSGTSQAEKGDGQAPKQQTVPERHEQRGEGTARYSNPPLGKEFGPGGREMGFGPGIPQHRTETEDVGKSHTEDFGESHDPAFGQRGRGNRGGGGKIDSTQRDMGQTGQTMKSSGSGEVRSRQQGPYGPPEKHPGPVAPGKPLTDDWGRSDKH